MSNEADSLIAELEADTSRFESPYERATVYRQAAKLYRASGDEPNAQFADWKAMLFEFTLQPRSERHAGASGRFVPMIQVGNHSYPDFDLFLQDAVDAIREEMAKCSNPVHRALYGDFLWEKSKDPEARIVAIQAYLDAADLHYQNKWYDQMADGLDRAAELSMRLNHQEGVARAKAAALRYAGTLVSQQRDPEVMWASDLVNTLQRFGKLLGPKDHEELVRLAEEGSKFYDTAGQYRVEQLFLELLPVSYAALQRYTDAKNAKRRFALSLEKEGDALGSHIGAVHFLQEALRKAADAGDPALVERLKLRLAQEAVASESEFHTISATVTVPRDRMDAWLNRLLTLDLMSALHAIVLSSRFIPLVESVRGEVPKCIGRSIRYSFWPPESPWIRRV